jgi:hypothetical protein
MGGRVRKDRKGEEENAVPICSTPNLHKEENFFFTAVHNVVSLILLLSVNPHPTYHCAIFFFIEREYMNKVHKMIIFTFTFCYHTPLLVALRNIPITLYLE